MITEEMVQTYNEWYKHNPFERASPELIRRVEQAREQSTKIETKEFFNNLEEGLF